WAWRPPVVQICRMGDASLALSDAMLFAAAEALASRVRACPTARPRRPKTKNPMRGQEMVMSVCNVARTTLAGAALAGAALAGPACAQTPIRFSLDFSVEVPPAPFRVGFDKGH